MKKKLTFLNIFSALLILLIGIVEKAVILKFFTPERSYIYRNFRYFSMIPPGYSDFFPLAVIALTIAILIFSILNIRGHFRGSKVGIVFSAAAIVLNIAPVFIGMQTFSRGLIIIEFLLFIIIFDYIFILATKPEFD